MALIVSVAGAAIALGAPASAAVPQPPKISTTEATFAIPAGATNTWGLRLWSHGTLEGSSNGTKGMLKVAVPATSDCAFQADVSVVSATGQRYFYSGARAIVPGCGPPSTVAGDIYLCSAAGAPTTTEVSGGTLAATGPEMLPSQSNPIAPKKVPAGTFTMTATSPSGYVFVACGGPATVASSGTSASEPVVVPAGGAGAGTFYIVVAAPTGSLSGGSNPGGGSSGAAGGPPTSPGSSGPVQTEVHHSQPVEATKVGSSALAFTGFNAAPVVLLGLGTLALGLLATATSRLRRRTAVTGATSRRSR
jgi:hypothetical protein